MPSNQSTPIARFIDNLVAEHHLSHLTDRELLRRFTTQREEAAFLALLKRHGTVIQRICRRTLPSTHDADDIFQATFLVLLKKASALRWRDSIASWLHEVAFRLAIKTRNARIRRGIKEGQASYDNSSGDPLNALTVNEAQTILHEELNKLPETLRGPLVLCYLENATQEEAARQLGWSLRTLKRRLQRGRDLLHKRLTRRGLTLSAALSTSLLTSSPASATLIRSTLAAAVSFTSGKAGTIAAPVAVLVQGALGSMYLTKLKVVAVVVTCLVGGLALVRTLPGPRNSEATTTISKLPNPRQNVTKAAVLAQLDAQKPEDEPAPKLTDFHGDLLPDGASARFGTVRFRHPFWITGVAYSSDGKTLASSGWDSAIRLWDARTGKEMRAFRPSDPERGLALLGVGILKTGKLIGLANHGTTYVWDVETGKETQLKGRNGFGLAISKDEKTLAKGLAGEDDDGQVTQVELWDLESGKKLPSLGSLPSLVQAIAFAPDRKLIAFGDYEDIGQGARKKDGREYLIHIWDTAAGKAVMELRGHNGGITSIAFSPDGKILVSAGHDGVMCFWDSITGQRDRTIKVPDKSSVSFGDPFKKLGIDAGGIESLAFSPDGRLVASGGFDGEIRIWVAASGAELHLLRPHGAEVTSLAFSPDSKSLASGSRDQTIRVWDTDSGKEVQVREGHDGSVHNIVLSPDGQTLASASWDRKIRLWSLATGKLLNVISGHTGSIFTIAYSPNGKMLASGGDDSTIRVWDSATGQELRKIDGQTGNVYGIAFVPPGNILVSGIRSNNAEGAIKFWDLTTGKELRQIDAPINSTLDVSSDGRVLAGHANGVRFWDTATGAEIGRLNVATSHFALSRDGRTCWTSDESGRMQLWSVESGKELRSITGPASESGWVGVPNLVISDDGRLLAHTAAADDRTVRYAPATIGIFETATGKLRRQLKGHDARVVVRAFSADGRTLFTGSDDTTILAWNLTNIENHPTKPSEANLEAFWRDLGSDDGELADRAIRSLIATQQYSTRFLKIKLRPAAPIEPNLMVSRIEELKSDAFEKRQKAFQELQKMDEQAAPALRKALGEGTTLESKRRMEELLARLRLPITSPELLRSYRSVEVLEKIGTRESMEVLQTFAKGTPEARQTQEAVAALRRKAHKATEKSFK